MAVIKGGFEIVKRAMLKELMKRGDDGIMLTLPKNELVDLNARITMDRLIKAGIDPESLTSPDQVLNVLENINNQMMKNARVISADSAEGKTITDKLFGKKGEVVEFPQKKTFKEEIEAMKKSGDIVDVEDVKISEKITDRDMFKNSNLNKRDSVTETISYIKTLEPMDAMKEANSVIGRKGKYKNLTPEESQRILKETDDHIFERDIPDEDFATGGRAGYQTGNQVMPAVDARMNLDYNTLVNQNTAQRNTQAQNRKNYRSYAQAVQAQKEEKNRQQTADRAQYQKMQNMRNPNFKIDYDKFQNAYNKNLSEKYANPEMQKLLESSRNRYSVANEFIDDGTGNMIKNTFTDARGKPITRFESLANSLESSPYFSKYGITDTDYLGTKQNLENLLASEDAKQMLRFEQSAPGYLPRTLGSVIQNRLSELQTAQRNKFARENPREYDELMVQTQPGYARNVTAYNRRPSDFLSGALGPNQSMSDYLTKAGDIYGLTTDQLFNYSAPKYNEPKPFTYSINQAMPASGQLSPFQAENMGFNPMTGDISGIMGTGISEGTSYINNPPMPLGLAMPPSGNYQDNFEDPDAGLSGQEIAEKYGIEYAKGGRAGYYTGGMVDVEPNLSDIGHGSDALMARTRLVSPDGQATTSTGLNYLLAEDNDNIRVPFSAGGGGRRAFLKLLATLGGGVAAAKSGILGLGKGAGKQVTKEVAKEVATGSGTVPPYFLNLVSKIKNLGDETMATQDKAIAKKYKDYVMEEDFAGNIEIIKKGDDVAGNKTEDVYMSLKVDEVPLKGKKGSAKVEEYEEFTARPDGEGKMKDVEPGVPDEVVQEGTMFEDTITEFGKAEGGRIGFSGGGIFRAIIAKAAAAKGLKPYEFIKVTSYKSLPPEVKMFLSADDFAKLKSGQKDMYSNYIDMAKTRKDFQQQVEAGKTTPAKPLFENMEKMMDKQSYVPKTVTADDIAEMELMVKNRFNKGRKDNALGGLQTMLGE